MARKRKLYSWRNLVICIIALTALVFMTLSVEHLAPEWIFYAVCIALLYGLIYIFARQHHSKIKAPQWGLVVATACVVPQIVVYPLIHALIADEGYANGESMGISFMVCSATVLLILIISSLIFKKRDSK
ncbi:MAG: hypothetical protein IKB68_04540 [Rikenellaceae bacterium]|nr:hypothetical protein [Rikenellaceae bacterium]